MSVGGKVPASARRNPVRVLVVEGPGPGRDRLLALISADPEIELAGCASDGRSGVEAVARLHPDVVAMSLLLPVLSSSETAARIMRSTPTPIVMLSHATPGAESEIAAGALRAGALALVSGPSRRELQPQAGKELLRTLKAMAQIKVVHRWQPSGAELRRHACKQAVAPAAAPTPAQVRLVAIGASTGGPRALCAILSQLPESFSPPVLVVQHIAPGFEASLAGLLASECALPIQLATNGAPLSGKMIYLAASGSHLSVRAGMLSLSNAPPVSGHRPSVTVLMRSVASEYGNAAIGILLSGMGDDGAEGLRDLHRAGGTCLAQDEQSAVVFGMPAAAIRLGAVDHVLSPEQIGAFLARIPATALTV